MAINAHKLGPGLLTFGAAGSSKEFSVECTKVVLTPESQDGDALLVLSGDRDQDSPEETFKLEITMLQNLQDTGAIAWTWTNAGTTQPFVFVPSSEHTMQCKGEIRVARLAIGGDVGKRNTSDVTFTVLGAPELTFDYAPPVG